MNKYLIILFSVLLLFQSCKREGCTDPVAINYDFGKKVKSNPETCVYYGDAYKNTLTKTIQCSQLNSNTTWPKVVGADVDYYVNCELIINKRLIIDAGVVVEFGPEGKLKFQGTGSLYADGSVSNRITLRGVNQEAWEGVTFLSSSSYVNKLNYINIEDAYDSSYDAAIYVSMAGSFTSNNLVIKNSDGYGMNIASFNTNSTLNNTSIENCGKSVLLLNSTIALLPNLATLTFSNTENFIEMPSSNFNSFSLSNEISNPIYFSGKSNSSSNSIYFSSFHVSEPNSFVFHEKYATIAYSINCTGSAGNKINFTSKDPSGFWLGLEVNMPYSPIFDNININNVALLNGSIRVTNYSPAYQVKLTNSIVTCGTGSSCGLSFNTAPTTADYDITGTTFTCANQVCP